MATNFTMRTTIVRASSGKGAIASAAYQSAEKLYDERLGKSFSYRSKEEVVHTEILLPQGAPPEFKDREKLWNTVQRDNDRINARWSRQFIIAVPNEWSREESIERSKAFIQKEFVDKGMIADWAYHEKDGNHHLHVMCTTRGIDKNGKWMPMEKKVYARDANGNKIPLIDPKTGEQKVRERNRNGVHTRELCWERITVQANNWNSKIQLREWKNAWAEHCNQYLLPEEQIDPRTYEERGIDRIPEVHEGPAAHIAAKYGVKSWSIKENEERRELNIFFDSIRELIAALLKRIKELTDLLAGRRYHYDKSRWEVEKRYTAGSYAYRRGEHSDDGAAMGRNRVIRPESCFSRGENTSPEERNRTVEQIVTRISAYREKLDELRERNRKLTKEFGRVDGRKHAVEEIARRINEVISKRRKADERRNQIRNTLLGRVGGAVDAFANGRTVLRASEKGKGTEGQEYDTTRRHKR